jgi:carbamoyltransferase
MTHILGISAGFHDAAVAVVDRQGRIEFAAHSERYSKLKNDAHLSQDLVKALAHWNFDTVAYYERPWMHNLQQWVSGQKQYGPWTTGSAVRRQIGNTSACLQNWPHHLSHAAAGFQTSPFETAAVMVIDAIGELDTVSIYRAWYDQSGQAKYQRMWRQKYPHSIGLFYSAITKRLGLKPMEDEYVTMGMAAYGNRILQGYLADIYIDDFTTMTMRRNLHIGIESNELSWMTDQDIAACAQAITEHMIDFAAQRARAITGETNLVYCGGVALNCVANRHLGRHFDRIWIMPNPGDAGSSLGAAALSLGRRLQWRDAFLGHEITGAYPINAVVQHLQQHGIVGVASGRAEFGPRALGNRSLLADPRGAHIRDRVNDIKQRQQFRPFAPAILEEYTHQYFDMPRSWNASPYMQTVASLRRPDLFPAITHVDGTARVQTVPPDGSGIRAVLESWYQRTGCPMLLNTSLNIRGEPMVNDRADALRFEQTYKVKVCGA